MEATVPGHSTSLGDITGPSAALTQGGTRGSEWVSWRKKSGTLETSMPFQTPHLQDKKPPCDLHCLEADITAHGSLKCQHCITFWFLALFFNQCLYCARNTLLYLETRISQPCWYLWFRNGTLCTVRRVCRIQWLCWHRVRRACLPSWGLEGPLSCLEQGFSFSGASLSSYFWEVSRDCSETFQMYLKNETLKQDHRNNASGNHLYTECPCSQRHPGWTLWPQWGMLSASTNQPIPNWSSQRRKGTIQQLGSVVLTGGSETKHR